MNDMPEMTEEEKKESEGRMALFDEEYKALVEKHQCDFGQSPAIVPIAPGMWGLALRSEIIDMKRNGIPSPLQHV